MDEKHHLYLTLFMNVTVANLSELLLVYVADFPPGTVIKKILFDVFHFPAVLCGATNSFENSYAIFFSFFFFERSVYVCPK